MKKQQITVNILFIIFAFFIFLMSNIFAQRVVNVAQGFGTLNEAIDGDTTDTGERTDLNTIYVLESGGTYLLNGSLENSGFPLHIEAEEGATERPKLIPGVPTGGESARPFRPRSDVTVKGLYITGEDELGALTTRMFRVSSENLRIVIDNCQLDKDGQSAFRLDDDGTTIIMTNSIMSNIGLPLNPNNGRGIDDRGNDIDTLIMINNTFYNITSRVLRDDGGTIGFADIRHNTFVNIGQFVMSFGEVIEAKFEDNNLINGAFYGRNTNEVEGNSLASANAQWLQFKPLGTDIDSTGTLQSISIMNNNFFLDSSLVAVYPDSVEVVPVLDSLAQVFVDANGTAETNISEAISFTNGPATEVTMVEVIWSDLANTPNWDNTNAPFDFAYDNTAESYTAAYGEFPLGDLNWFPGKKTEWENYVPPVPLILVDGEKDAFFDGLTGPDDGYLQLRYYHGNDNGFVEEDADLSAKIWFAWDEDWFYTYTEVTDDIVLNTSANAYQNDVIELKIDPIPTDAANSIVSLDLTALDAGSGVADIGSVADEASKMYARKIVDGGYVLEMGVKWDAILAGTEMVSAAVDSVFGLAINFHDNDATTREASVMWAAVMMDAVWNTPANLGTAKFLEGNKIQMIPTNNFTPENSNDLPYDGSEPVGVEDVNILPTEYALDQNYPNPFNPTTTINFALPENSVMKLVVHNILGQEVATLINQEMAAGYHTLNFDANAHGLASGIYIYRLSTDSKVFTKKLVLLK